jgi:hypothetical protein
MRKRHLLVPVLLLFSAAASAQYVEQRPTGPFFGGPGDYSYPLLCTQCSAWQDFRIFAWNQLSINGGTARTPSDPKAQTTFRIYTHATNDLHPTIVEVTLVIVDVVVMGNVVGQRQAEHKHYTVETHPDNGDRVDTAFYPRSQGPLEFPYRAGGTSSGNAVQSSGSGASASGSGGGGGDSPSGGFGGFFGAADVSSAWELWSLGFNSSNFCGAGTNYVCVQK